MSEHINVSAPNGTKDKLQKAGLSPSKVFAVGVRVSTEGERDENTGELVSSKELKDKIFKLSALVQHLTQQNERLTAKLVKLGGA